MKMYLWLVMIMIPDIPDIETTMPSLPELRLGGGLVDTELHVSYYWDTCQLTQPLRFSPDEPELNVHECEVLYSCFKLTI